MFVNVHQVGLDTIIIFIYMYNTTKRKIRAYRQRHVTICLTKFAVGERSVAIRYIIIFCAWLCYMNMIIVLLLLPRPFNCFFSSTTWVSRHQKGGLAYGFHWSKRWLDGSGIGWTICKSLAPRFRQITTPAPHHSVFYRWMLFLKNNQQRQSTEGNLIAHKMTQWTNVRRSNRTTSLTDFMQL